MDSFNVHFNHSLLFFFFNSFHIKLLLARMGAKELDSFFTRMGLKGFYPMGIWTITIFGWILKAFMFSGNPLIAFPVDYNCNEEDGNGTSSGSSNR